MLNLINVYQHMENLEKIMREIEKDKIFISHRKKIAGRKLLDDAISQIETIIYYLLSKVDELNEEHLNFINNLNAGSSEHDMAFLKKQVEREKAKNSYPYNNFFESVVTWSRNIGNYDKIQLILSEFDGIITCFINDNPDHDAVLLKAKNEYMNFLEKNIHSCNTKDIINNEKNSQTLVPAEKKLNPSSSAALNKAIESKPAASVTHSPINIQSMSPQGGKILALIIIPIIITTGFIMATIAFFSILFIIPGIVGFIWLLAGINSYRNKCEVCGCWNAYRTINSVAVDKERVKVRRTVHTTGSSRNGRGKSGYYHSSRQILVSADEITYKELYQCKSCNHQKEGYRKIVDDKIRR